MVSCSQKGIPPGRRGAFLHFGGLFTGNVFPGRDEAEGGVNVGRRSGKPEKTRAGRHRAGGGRGVDVHGGFVQGLDAPGSVVRAAAGLPALRQRHEAFRADGAEADRSEMTPGTDENDGSATGRPRTRLPFLMPFSAFRVENFIPRSWKYPSSAARGGLFIIGSEHKRQMLG